MKLVVNAIDYYSFFAFCSAFAEIVTKAKMRLCLWRMEVNFAWPQVILFKIIAQIQIGQL